MKREEIVANICVMYMNRKCKVVRIVELPGAGGSFLVEIEANGKKHKVSADDLVLCSS
jgi:hypothetical protein